MDQQSMIIMIVLVMILVIMAIYFGLKKLKQYRLNKIGKTGEKAVKKVLKKICRKYDYRLINDLYLPLYDKTTQIDHVVIGAFGIMAVETKAMSGEVFGNDFDENWVQIIGDKRHKMYNPLRQNKTHVDCIKHLLRQEQIYRVEVDSLVVFAGKKVTLNIQKGLPVISLSYVKKFFKKSRYQNDNGVNVQKLYETLLSYQVTDKTKLKQHNSNVKKMAKGKL